MPARNQIIGSKWIPWVYGLLVLPQVLLLIALWQGALRDSSMGREVSRRDQMHELQSRAMQRARGLEVLVEAFGSQELDWSEMQDEPWLLNHWKQIQLSAAHDLYSAVIDGAGYVVLHTDPQRVGQRLDRGWYERRVSESRPDVVWAPRSALVGERPAYDVMVPLTAANHRIGEYHEGIDPGRVESSHGMRQNAVSGGWAWALICAFALNVAACGGLVHLAREHSRLWRVWNGESQQRAKQMAKLGAGLAHEIRNPLHALRINLHVLRRAFGGRSTLPEDQLIATISESNSAIDRLDQLMRDLLQLSDSSTEGAAEINLVQEMQSALGLLAEELKRDQITVRCSLPADSLSIMMDPVRLRQSLFNLFVFAKHRAGKGGSIDVGVVRRDEGVEINIRDSGPTLTTDQSEHVFEPFQASVGSGSGLGLALVQMYVENAGGRTTWGGTAAEGGCCRVWFPLASH